MHLFSYSKIVELFLTILLEHLIKYKVLSSEECITSKEIEEERRSPLTRMLQGL